VSRRLGVASAIVDGTFLPGDVAVEDGVVVSVGLPPGRAGMAVPGMVDLQVNGCAGVDLLAADPDGWTQVATALARAGVTAFVANLITSPEDDVTRALRTAAQVTAALPAAGAATLLGAHLEGPFLAPSRAGTHPQEHLRPPDLALVERLRAAGPVVGITLAPELPGALEVVAALARDGVLVSLGHSAATGTQAHAGFDAGARTVTHVFNAMSAPTAREPGLAGVALTRADVAVQLICDGVHLARDTVALVVLAAGDRFVLVTDALSAAGAGDGQHRLGSVEITVVGGQARRADGTLAGSVLSMADALRRVVDAGACVEDAVAAATARPAALLGRRDLGRIVPGARADIVVLDDALEVTTTVLAGSGRSGQG